MRTIKRIMTNSVVIALVFAGLSVRIVAGFLTLATSAGYKSALTQPIAVRQTGFIMLRQMNLRPR
jgi:hypothetical protein